MRGLLVVMFFAACASAPPAPDAGATCTGVPARLQAQCVALDFYEEVACAGSADQVLDAGRRACGGGTGRGACEGFDVVSWQYGPFGDTYQCFFAPDGGALRGAINFSDHGVLAAGAVSDCPHAVEACDGGP